MHSMFSFFLSGLFYLPLHDLNPIPALRVLLPPPRGDLLRGTTAGAGNRREEHLLSRKTKQNTFGGRRSSWFARRSGAG